MRFELGPCQPEDPAPTVLELQPEERQIRECSGEPRFAVTHLHEQRAVRPQMSCRVRKDATRDIETVGAGPQREIRLVTILAWQLRHLGVAHIGRVGDDDIVAAPGHRPVQVAFEELHAASNAVPRDVAAREFQGSWRYVHCVDPDLRKRMCAGDRDAPRSGAEIKHATNASWIHPRPERGEYQLREGRAWHDHPGIHLELESREPHPPHQVCRGYPLVDALGEGREHGCALPRFRPLVVRDCCIGVIEAEHMKHKGGRIVERCAGAVTVHEAGALELRRTEPDQLRNARVRRQPLRLLRGHGAHLRCGIIAPLPDPVSPQPRMSVRPLLIGAVAIVAFAVGVLLARSWQGGSPEAPQRATEITPPRELPAVSLIDQDGEPLQAAFFRAGWTLVFFGFTRCPDICPTTLATLAQARASLGDLPVAQQPRVLLVSVDPEYDRAPLLRDYVRFYDPAFLAATGDPSAVASVAAGFGVPYAKVATDSDTYTVDHGAGVFFVAPDGIAAYSSAPHDAAVLAHDYRLVLARHGRNR